MKWLFIALCGLFAGGAVLSTPVTERKLGARECTWGPTYWCSNITNAKGCNAVSHCIQTVWEKQQYPEDTDSICQICLDMVKQARDQLESNMTQEDLKAVFEGSCNLMPIKIVRKECIKLADDFIPELVEALASQMNPNVVCSVAGLCNNAGIDKLLENYNGEIDFDSSEEKTEETTGLSCSGCNNVASLISDKFHSSNRDDILESMLRGCSKLSSFSDGCSNIAIVYFDELYNHMEKNLNAENICHMSGVCSGKFHQHPELVEIRPMSDVGVVSIKDDDIPCELCEQLVTHLRDLLIANTTEIEFKSVLEGLCNQTKSFKSECTSIVDQYYDIIYSTLIHNLDANGACFMIGVCPKKLGNAEEDHPIMPLLPTLTAQRIQVTLKEKPKFILGANEPKLTQQQIQDAQLPIDRILGAQNPETLVNGGEWCTLCEYFLHFVQEAISSPKNEEDIKRAVGETCNKLPKSIQTQCHSFVNMYGDAVIALMIQEMDPTEICPAMKICPSGIEDMEVFAPIPIDVTIQSKGVQSNNCPLCLLSVTQLQKVIKSDKSVANIKNALKNLCVKLPQKLKLECSDFVETYAKELVEMLVMDFTPQQICVYMKCCTDNRPDKSELNIDMDSDEVNENGDILTNEIPDDTINGQLISSQDIVFIQTPECALCTQIIREVEKRIVNKDSKEQIKHALEHVCDKMKKMKKKCHDYVDNHSDLIIDLIIKGFAPKEICRELQLCSVAEEIDDSTEDLETQDDALIVSIVAQPVQIPFEKMTTPEKPTCVICEFVMSKLEDDLKDKKTQDQIKKAVLNVCSAMPKSVRSQCNQFINQYAEMIIDLLDTMPPKKICMAIDMCNKQAIEGEGEILECGICQITVMALHKILETDVATTDIEFVLEKACQSIPAKYNQKCMNLVKIYGTSMVNLLKALATPGKVCKEIAMCFGEDEEQTGFVSMEEEGIQINPAQRLKRMLVGANKCTYGPSYWCAKKANADECAAVKFCEEKHWSNGVPPA